MAALKSYSQTTDTHNSTDRVDTWSMQIYPRSIRYGYYGGIDEWGYPRHYNEYYVGGRNLQALLSKFEVSSTKELIAKIATDQEAIIKEIKRWIGWNCDGKRR